ncbi:surface antigen family protein [Rickettsia felis str. Pedreira]|uniref:Antigenic heat-stable 120 kDa protein n=6 Tax=Rickettsia TaxID=780 RepID=SCA4_RICFE|nr:Sca4 family spreading effector [Rickettsia felis]Q9AJ37.2 RecName: Full=Antigenic heat-stable 120 kDa protein; AltName: Full=120 kDa antigen; AltName: Full=Protein PS 120; Short=PS120 [Rickettsia felis URRWXCal2]AAY61576.1 Cell surface antigen [Rickettsia felis URRWXCal2]KJV57694.1 surface antigen family protein [Rickettsia felis str. Pedreira]
MSKDSDNPGYESGYESDTEEKKQEQAVPAQPISSTANKDGNPDTSEFDPLANKEYTEEQKQKLEQEQKEYFSQTTPQELEADDGFSFTPASSTQSTPSISSLSGGISSDSQTSDPITKAVRETIIQPQKDEIAEQILKDLAALADRDLAEQKRKEIEEEKDKTLSAFFGNPANREFIDKALENPELKKKLESIEIAGYKNVLSTYSAANGYQGGFKPVQWENQISASDLRATVVRNDAGDELCTLNETTVKTKPFTVAKQDGTQVQINSYREIDFPIKLDKADGSMHLSMVALKADGTKPSKDKAVYFTAHYEEGPNGKPQLKEISSPKPLKFAGDGPDAVAYIEHGGEIYTLAVTRGKYKEMMREVELNQGQSVDLSQTIAEDLTKVQGRSQETPQPIITPNQELKSSIETPTTTQVPPITPANQPLQPETSQMPQPQQVNPNLLNAATALSTSMQDLLNYVNAGLTKEKDGNKQIDLINEAATAILNNEKSDIAEKQANIIALTENTVNNNDLTPDTKVAGVNAVLETIKNDQNTPDLEKSKMLEATVAIALNSENLEPKQKQQMLEKAVDVGLSLKDDASRVTAIDGITDAVIKSNLSTEDKGTMLIAVGDKVNASELSNAEKQKLLGSVLKKGVEAQVLSPEQQQLMQQNLDKITAEQTKNAQITEVQGILANPAFNTIAKTEAIQNVTTKVLDSPIKAEIKGETLESITKVVAESPLNGQDKADIVKGMGEAIASHKTMAPTEKISTIESVEKGVAESITDLEDKKLMTKGLVEGIYEGKANPEITSEKTKAVSRGIDKSTAIPEDKQALKDAANEAALDRETQNLTEGLKRQNLGEPKPRDDIYNKAQDVADALKNVITPVLDAHPEKREVSEEEEVVKKTSSILNDISKLAIEKVNNFRAMLSPDGNLKTLEEKKAESTKKVDELVKEFGTKSSTEEQQSFIKANLIDDKTLSKEIRLQTINKLLQEQAQKRAEAIENPNVKTEDVRVVSGVNIKDNIKIMGALMNARDSIIQSENLNKSTPIKRESSFPPR